MICYLNLSSLKYYKYYNYQSNNSIYTFFIIILYILGITKALFGPFTIKCVQVQYFVLHFW